MEHRLIDANNLGVGKANPDIFVCEEYAHGWNNALQAVVDAAPTIDPESLPVVRQLREELARVTAERDAAIKDLEQAIDVYRDDEGWDLLCRFCDGKSCREEKECVPKWRGPQKEE